MSLLGSLIITVCVGTGPGQYQAACNGALDAGTKQTGIDKDVEMVEKNVTKGAEARAREIVPDSVQPAIGGFIFIAKTAVDRKLSVPLPGLGICDKVQSEITPNSAVISMRWSF